MPRNPFESKELWSAREMAQYFGYPEPFNFERVVDEGIEKLKAWEYPNWGKEADKFIDEADEGDFRIVIQKAIVIGGFYLDEITKNFVYQAPSNQPTNPTGNHDDINLSPIAAWWVFRCF